MTLWGALGLLLGGLFLLDALRMRRRVGALPPLSWQTSGGGDYVLLVAPGVHLPEDERHAAAAYAKEQGLLVLDLVPRHWSALRAMGFLQGVDPARFRAERLASGWSAGQALLVDREVLQRAGLPETVPSDSVGFLRLARTLKQYAPTQFGFAVSPGLSPRPLPPAERFAVFRDLFHALTPSVLAGQLALFVLTALAAWKGSWPGLVGLVSLHVQPLIALSGGPILPHDLERTAVLAWPTQVWEWISAVASARPDPARQAKVATLRARYTSDYAAGEAHFFEPRRERCLVCDGSRLAVQHRLPDLLQHKPGHFTVERCLDCGHLFQNPQLTPAGLEFYYRDFYDGLGGPWLETIFAMSGGEYLSRARALAGEPPARWLDVGGGYGHFSLAAREVWPSTRFETLDMGSSADEAVRRGWADGAHRGLLPELASGLASQFDVVSMSHCLEHTRDPRAELKAARTVLKSGGSIIIEVPDPECVLRNVLRGLWLPYFQPQHQHLLSVKNLSRLLEEQGFEVTRVQRAEAHVGQDFLFAVFMALDWAAPEDFPWLPPPGRWHDWRRAVVWGLGAPFLLTGTLADGVVRRLASVNRMSNAYRVVAKAR